MAYLVILTGQRVDDVVELNPGATLTIGSDPTAHIHVPDSHVAPVHGQVYPAEGSYWFQDVGQGYSLVNLDPLANNAHALRANDGMALGRAFLTYVLDAPKAERVKEDTADELAERDAEIKRLRERLLTQQGEASKLARNTAELTKQTERDAEAIRQLEEAREQVKAELDAIRAGDKSAQKDAAKANEEKATAIAARDAALAELAEAKQELSRLGIELAEARADAEEQRQEASRASAEAEAGARQTEDERVARAQAEAELGAVAADLAAVRMQLEQTKTELAEVLDAGTAEDLAFAAGALSAAREALVTLGVPREAPALPRRNADDAGVLLDRALSPDEARKLEAKLTLWVEQESLRRLSGTSPAFVRDAHTTEIEQKLRSLRQRSAENAALSTATPGAKVKAS
ncbi:MAG: hypothetical protein AB8I08_34780 [Sandaracinaceae bacterium]